jgi:hypothetical protein
LILAGATCFDAAVVATSLEEKLAEIAAAFVQQLLTVIRGRSLADLAVVAGRGRAPRRDATSRAARSRTDLLTNQLVELLGVRSDGLTIDELCVELGRHAQDVRFSVGEALRDRRIAKRGSGRATTYFTVPT